MDHQQLFLDQFRTSGEAETIWLKLIFSFITEHIYPVLSGSAPPVADSTLTGEVVCPVQLSVCVVKAIQENLSVTHTLPVSYRPVSISELLSQQHLACVSNLSWSTNQQRAWVKEAELSLPGHRPLPRVNLLLIGCLREGRSGEWRLNDASGSIRCECVCLSPLWLNRPVFLPHWNYIPHNASEQGEASRHVELVGSPVLLRPAPDRGPAVDPGGGLDRSRVVGVREAAGLLLCRTRGQRLSVCGRVGSVCPLLVVAGTTFFCFSLSDDRLSVPVLIKDRRLWWSQCVCVGQTVCVTALRVCVLRGWRGNNILCATDWSEIHTNYPHTPAYSTHYISLAGTPPLLMMSHTDDDSCEEAEPETDTVQSVSRTKLSRVISYQGTVTEVVSEGAGLYVIDRKVALCLAYQPTLSRKLRAGDSVELHHVHFLYGCCPEFPPSILCTCLRSSLRVTTFSKVEGSPPDAGCPADGVLPRLLLQKNMGASQYLWTCHLSSQLSHSLVPSVLKQQCVCVLSWKLMEFVWRRERGGRRDIYSEMLDEPHTCPLTQYRVHPLVHQYTSISELNQCLQSDCWSSLSLRSLVPPDASCLSRSQINSTLAWSFRTMTSDPQSDPQTRDRPWQRPLLLVGMLELPSQTSEHTLHLRDGTGALACVVTENREGAQGAAFNTAWIGCLVCVHQFNMVIERFIQSEFPSIQHLDQHKYITHKHCRVYLQFSLDHLHILSPSVAMATHLRQRRVESCYDVTCIEHTVEEETAVGQTELWKRKREDSSAAMTTGPVIGSSRPCVSMVIRVENKEGVSRRNLGEELNKKEPRVKLSFSLQAVVIGPVVSWAQDPKNGSMTDRETETKQEEKVMLVFTGASTRWFPLLQPGVFYRLTAVNTQDLSVLAGCGVSGWSRVECHTNSTLQVRPEWRFHTLTLPVLKHTHTKAGLTTILSVSDVIDCRSELVCFQALVSDRTSLANRTRDSGDMNSGVRVTVHDQNERSLQVYLDYPPYPPGLLPGNTLLFSAFQRKLSRTGLVYCCHLPISSITVVTLGDSRSAGRCAPMMHLGVWAGCPEQRCPVAQSCSGSQCRSTSSVFQSSAKLVVDDGTGEAHIYFSGVLVRHLLGLSDSEWDGLQRALRVRGHLRVYPRGQNAVLDSDDALLLFLMCVCSRDAVCRQVTLTCRKHSNQRSEEVKRFSRGDRDFMTRMTPPLQLTCLNINSDLACVQ